MSNQFWNERYASVETVYGDRPNEFLKLQLSKVLPGKILFPAEGEGRNAIFAARLGWEVVAFDFSEQAQKKALKSAARQGVSINYSIQDIESITLPDSAYDVVALVFVHLPSQLRTSFHRKVVQALKPGGRVIMEVFSKSQLGKNSGGPKDIDMLYSAAELLADFKDLNIEVANEESVVLNEGPFHQGEADVVRLVAARA